MKVALITTSTVYRSPLHLQGTDKNNLSLKVTNYYLCVPKFYCMTLDYNYVVNNQFYFTFHSNLIIC
jgi:hypothetical protein